VLPATVGAGSDHLSLESLDLDDALAIPERCGARLGRGGPGCRRATTICDPAAERETDPEAKAAFLQLAEEFQGLTQEIEGLISSCDAVIGRTASSGPENDPHAGAR
jgi:hypothetical protein